MTQPDFAAIRADQGGPVTPGIEQIRARLYEDRIDDLEARNAKLEAVAKDDVRDMANFCIAQGASKPWQEIARRLLAALDALDD